jgi:hypothetical protein
MVGQQCSNGGVSSGEQRAAGRPGGGLSDAGLVPIRDGRGSCAGSSRGTAVSRPSSLRLLGPRPKPVGMTTAAAATAAAAVVSFIARPFATRGSVASMLGQFAIRQLSLALPSAAILVSGRLAITRESAIQLLCDIGFRGNMVLPQRCPQPPELKQVQHRKGELECNIRNLIVVSAWFLLGFVVVDFFSGQCMCIRFFRMPKTLAGGSVWSSCFRRVTVDGPVCTPYSPMRCGECCTQGIEGLAALRGRLVCCCCDPECVAPARQLMTLRRGTHVAQRVPRTSRRQGALFRGPHGTMGCRVQDRCSDNQLGPEHCVFVCPLNS